MTRSTSTTTRAGLDRADVVRAALHLVESGGVEALSMRKLATELGVTTTTIYWHVGTRDDLVLALISLLAEQQAEATVIGDTPRERVLSAAHNIWSNALAHRNVTALARQVGATTLLELPLEVALLAELNAAGVKGDAARDALRAIVMCVAGFLIGAWSPASATPDGLGDGELWRSVDDDRIDAASIEAMARPADLEELFRSTIRAVVEAHVPELSPPRRRGAR